MEYKYYEFNNQYYRVSIHSRETKIQILRGILKVVKKPILAMFLKMKEMRVVNINI